MTDGDSWTVYQKGLETTTPNLSSKKQTKKTNSPKKPQ